MMGRWAERAAQIEAEAAGRVDIVPAAQAIGANGTNGTGALPSAVTNGLLKMRTMRPPRRLINPDNWAGVVADAEALLMHGWAGQAILFGWSPLEIFGVSDDFDGLAVWLNGHHLVLLDDRGAVALDKPCGRTRHWFHRRDPAGAVMLWEWAR